jgi:8-oxo-dGTP pyrophosphatase MutT (NUDIX family)
MNTIQLEKKVKHWLDTVKKAGINTLDVKTIAEIRKKDNSLLFALLDTKMVSPEGTHLPNIVFIRGHACVIVPRIRNRKTSEELFLIVKQRRIGNGDLTIEFPAGMLDDSTEDPLGVAIRELEEETSLKINTTDVFELHKGPLYSSPGASDEAIYFYGCITDVDDEQFNEFKGKQCGNSNEHEFITVELAKEEDILAQCSSIQVMVGLYLFNKYTKST